MKTTGIISTLRHLLAGDSTPELRAFCLSLHPEDLATHLHLLSAPDQIRVLLAIGDEAAAEVMTRMTQDDQAGLVAVLPDAALAGIFTRMSSDDRADLFNNLDEDTQAKLLAALDQVERDDILKLSAYPEGTAGSIMSSDYASLSPELSVRQALDKLRVEAPDKETVYSLYVIDRQRRLLGVVSLSTLIIARPELTVGEIMKLNPVFVRVGDDQEEVARKLNRYDLLAIPVINGNDALAGIVTFDDVQDVMIAESTEDFHRMGGVSAHGASDLGQINMREAPFWLVVRKRLPWLLVLVFMNIFSGAGIAYFEDTIHAVVALVFFLPLLIDCGGNAGSQAATLMVRALATGQAQLRDWIHLLGREVFVSATLGLCMAAAVSLIGIFRAGPEVALVVSVTMVCTVLFGSLVGMSLPFLLSRLKMDPATASAPLITSIADIGGVMIYFTIASHFLRDMIVPAG